MTNLFYTPNRPYQGLPGFMARRSHWSDEPFLQKVQCLAGTRYDRRVFLSPDGSVVRVEAGSNAGIRFTALHLYGHTYVARERHPFVLVEITGTETETILMNQLADILSFGEVHEDSIFLVQQRSEYDSDSGTLVERLQWEPERFAPSIILDRTDDDGVPVAALPAIDKEFRVAMAYRLPLPQWLQHWDEEVRLYDIPPGILVQFPDKAQCLVRRKDWYELDRALFHSRSHEEETYCLRLGNALIFGSRLLLLSEGIALSGQHGDERSSIGDFNVDWTKGTVSHPEFGSIEFPTDEATIVPLPGEFIPAEVNA